MISPLGDGISSVELLGSFGDDLTVVNAARVSYAKESTWDDVQGISDPAYTHAFRRMRVADEKLINYLAKHGHWTPFAQPQLRFRYTMPLFVARQWFKHQIGLTRNEVSGRYVKDTPRFHKPTQFRMAPGPGQSKQGSGPVIEDKETIDTAVRAYWYAYIAAQESYEKLLELGVAPEQAREVLPLATYTQFIETGSLAAYARIYHLRSQPDAQLETQHYARAVGELIAPLFPVSWGALTSGK